MKYTINFKCGHNEVKELFGAGSERAKKIQWYEDYCVCSECYSKQQKKAEKAQKIKAVMKRAWEIYRTLIGDKIAKLSMALRQAWAEIKKAESAFKGFAKISKSDANNRECDYITFKAWEKNGKKRIYLNDYKGRTIGYIDQNNDNKAVIMDRQGNTASDIDFVINKFNSTYSI